MWIKVEAFIKKLKQKIRLFWYHFYKKEMQVEFEMLSVVYEHICFEYTWKKHSLKSLKNAIHSEWITEIFKIIVVFDFLRGYTFFQVLVLP